jgi:hypothetical protein
MGAIVDIISSVMNLFRFMVIMVFLCLFALGLMFTAGASYIAPKAAESLANTAEKVTDKAIEAQRLEARKRAYAGQGWGYSEDAAQARAEVDAAAQELEDDLNGWGE